MLPRPLSSPFLFSFFSLFYYFRLSESGCFRYLPYVAVKWYDCRGCRLCELACVRFHEGVANPELSRIRVYDFYPGPMHIPVVCTTCSDHPCATACPTGALAFDGKRMVVDTETCLGSSCAACVTTCSSQRSGAIHFSGAGADSPVVCDHCGGSPKCVGACPFDVLEYVPDLVDGRHMAESPSKIAQDIAERWKPATANKRLGANLG